MKTIIKKINPEYFEALLSGKKKYELRLNDTEYSEGDILHLKEWSESSQSFTGREIEKKITYVRPFKIDELHWTEEEIRGKGLVLISLE
ncbi:MAG TPA: DUF3850 domain-containing protein [Candidatus Paceibacterota bacterium]|jgi:ASC-1-like (ASCH) protein|nr:DUF3850 domain-containing protein [Candidatus Paceibacterota bacterium]